jgi:hypothetical protein
MPEYNGGMEKEYVNPYCLTEDHWLNHMEHDSCAPLVVTQEEKDNILPKSQAWKEYMSERMTGENNPRWNKPTSQKQKDAVSKAMKGKKKNYKVTVPKTVLYGADNGKSKEITVDGVTYPSQTAAAKALGIPRSTLTWRINRGKNLNTG